jgi:hypothetical protein
VKWTVRHAVVLSVLLWGVGCRGRDPEPPPSVLNTPVPIFYIYTDSGDRTSRDELAALFKQAGIEAKIPAISEVPPDELPEWVDGKRKGWLFLIPPKQHDAAEVVWKAYFDRAKERGVKVKEKKPPEPLALGPATEIAPDVAAAIRAELDRRRVHDQAVRTDPDRRDEMKKVDADNTAYLKDVVMRHGWIDVKRFGVNAADAAFLIVQHSGDFPLMLAALPKIESDVKARRLSSQNYAFLYDRIHFMLGGKQRYGTQLVRSAAGKWVVSRLEDPDHVDQRRREIGLSPLRDYLEGFDDEVTIER